MPSLRSIQTRYTLFLVLFVLLLFVLTVVGIGQLVAPSCATPKNRWPSIALPKWPSRSRAN